MKTESKRTLFTAIVCALAYGLTAVAADDEEHEGRTSKWLGRYRAGRWVINRAVAVEELGRETLSSVPGALRALRTDLFEFVDGFCDGAESAIAEVLKKDEAEEPTEPKKPRSKKTDDN